MLFNLPLSGSSTPFKSLTISGTAKIGSGSVISLLDGASAPTITSTNAPDSGVTLELSGYTGDITSNNLTVAYDTLVYNGGVGSFASNQTVDAKYMNNQNISLQGVFKPASSYSSSLTNLNKPVVTLKSGGFMEGSTYHAPFIPTMSLASGGEKGKFVFDLSQDSTMGTATFTVTDIFSKISFLSANVLPQWDITLGNNRDIRLDGSLCTSGSCLSNTDFTLNTSESTVTINNNTSRDDFISGLIRGTGQNNILSLNAGGTSTGLTLNLGTSETFSQLTTAYNIDNSSFTLKSGGIFDVFSGTGNTLNIDGSQIDENNTPSPKTLYLPSQM